MRLSDPFLCPMRNSYLTYLLVGIIIALSLTACSSKGIELSSAQRLTGQIDSLLLSRADRGVFSGTVAIGTQTEMIHHSAYGIANRTFDLPMRTDFRFDIASVNKSMIAALVMIAVEEGLLTTDERLVNLLEGYSYTGSYHQDITVHKLLTHTSGLPDYNAVNEELAANNYRAFKRLHFSNSEYIDFISRLEPVAEPGTTFHYSNFGYHLLSLLLENLYDMPFDELLKLKISDPLGMDRTYSTTSNEAIFNETVDAYRFDEEAQGWIKNSFIDLTIGRRVFSTSENLYRWAKAMNDTTFLSEESLNQMTINHLNELEEEVSYGYGWVVYNEGDDFSMGNLNIDKPYIIHGGSTEGYKSILINIDDGEWILSILANSGNRTNELELAQGIIEIIKSYNSL